MPGQPVRLGAWHTVSRELFLGLVFSTLLRKWGRSRGWVARWGRTSTALLRTMCHPGCLGLCRACRGGHLGVMGGQGVMGHVSCLSPLQHQRCPCGHSVHRVTLSHCYQPAGKALSQGMGEEIRALWAVPGQGPCLPQPRWDICLGFTSLPQPAPCGENRRLGNTWEEEEIAERWGPSLTCIPHPAPPISMGTWVMTTICSPPPLSHCGTPAPLTVTSL